jgi:hypothetical protein
LRRVACSRGRASLSNDVPVNDVERNEDVNGAPSNGSGVLANLPRARPQRSSARRVAARERNGSGTAMREQRPPASTPSAATSKTAGATRKRAKAKASDAALADSPTAKRTGATDRASTPRSGATKRPTARRRTKQPPIQEPAPRQGFESESDTPSGSLQPPGGLELVASAAELVGELAKAGLSRSERLLKDVVSRLPLS